MLHEYMDLDDMVILLGNQYVDTISGLVGRVEMIGQDLSGVKQCLLQPKCLTDNKLPECHWVDIKKLEKI